MNHDQFSLPFLDTTSLGGGFGLYDRSPTPKPTPTREDAGLFETPAPDPTASLPTQNRTLAVTAHDYRCQAPSWNENMKVFSELAINRGLPHFPCWLV